ncbi:MAG: 4-hydroxy-tetrahydrodipicolinate reductase [Candidatus Cloacimonadota bacterium]|nr:MAG: 4-hydroxy-tetrahydrodipicolinate reductase [Candidatus Cloacimonadota bacterium]
MIKVIVSGISGKMGKEIVRLSEEFEDISIIAGFDIEKGERAQTVEIDVEKLPKGFDVIVDFSSPQGAIDILQFSVENKKPFVTGTTDFSEDEESAIVKASREIPVLKASNMSVGINTLIRILEGLPDMFYKKFDIEVVETHHRMKKDSPSGTAKTLAKIISNRSGKTSFIYGREGSNLQRKHDDIGMHSLRGGTVVGTHTIFFHGDNESIEITHRAHSRRIFALGALSAARWIVQQKPGLYSMQDLLL